MHAVPIPPDLLAAASDRQGGKWVLVVGAGASVEQPTGLPTGAQCSIEAHRRLRADGVLDADCAHPWDLSEVADAVYARDGKQAALVQQLPVNRFRTAEHNSGHLIAAVLLAEGSLAGVVTLNFDLSMSAALAAVGSGDLVSVISGPDDIRNLSNLNLVYLHRNAEAPAEEWILRSEFLNRVWADRWEPVIANRVLVAPNVVFAGLGSPAAALTRTIELIRNALPDAAVRIYQVDLAPYGTLPFTGALKLPPNQYLQIGWCAFMEEVAARVLAEHWNTFETAIRTAATENSEQPPDVRTVADACRRMGLFAFGAARARWLQHDGGYARTALVDSRLIADLLSMIQLVTTRLGASLTLRADGVMELNEGPKLIASIALLSGRGVRTITAVEAALAVQSRYRPWTGAAPRTVVVTGHLPSPPATTPTSIIAEVDENDIVGGARPRVVSAYDLRATPALIDGLGA